jgi:transposase
MSIAKPRNAAAKRLFDNFDVVIVNPLRVQQIAHESKNDNSMRSTARRNMHLLSPSGSFVDRLKQVALQSERKKLIFGFGERGTSKTCVICGRIDEHLQLSQKTVTCCGLTMDRDIRGCTGNFCEA